jgi:hypothetical protein
MSTPIHPAIRRCTFMTALVTVVTSGKSVNPTNGSGMRANDTTVSTNSTMLPARLSTATGSPISTARSARQSCAGRNR